MKNLDEKVTDFTIAYNEVMSEMSKVSAGNKAAARRTRKRLIEFVKQCKELREVILENTKAS